MAYIKKLYNNKYVDPTIYNDKLKEMNLTDNQVKDSYNAQKIHSLYILENSDKKYCIDFFRENLNSLNDDEIELLKAKIGDNYGYVEQYFQSYTNSCINMCNK